MQERKGKLIVIEGIDGTGKATQTNLLAHRARREGFPIEIFSFPRYGVIFGGMVGEYLRGEFGDLHPKLAALLYALDRKDASEEMNYQLKYDNLILNRYVGSNLAHQAARLEKDKRKEFIDWIRELEYEKLKVPREDFVICLDLPVSEAINAMENQGKKRDIHEADANYLEQVRQTYRMLSKNRNWKLIGCVARRKRKSIEELSEEIWQIVKPILVKF